MSTDIVPIDPPAGRGATAGAWSTSSWPACWPCGRGWCSCCGTSPPIRSALPSARCCPVGRHCSGGGWLFAGVLTALVIRKPGAALYGEMVAATVSALVGNQWGVLPLESGLVQGLAAELVFAVFLYRAWSLPVAVLSGAAAGLALAINDLILWYPGFRGDVLGDLRRVGDRLGRADRRRPVLVRGPRSGEDRCGCLASRPAEWGHSTY